MKSFFKLFSILIFFSLIVVSCGGTDPVSFNDSLVSYIDKSHDQEEKIASAIEVASLKADFANIEVSANVAIDSITTYIKEVENIKPAKGGDTLQAHVIEYLHSLVVMIESYKSLSAINEKTSEEDINLLFDKITEKEDLTMDLFSKIEAEQKLFAKKNNKDLKQ